MNRHVVRACLLGTAALMLASCGGGRHAARLPSAITRPTSPTDVTAPGNARPATCSGDSVTVASALGTMTPLTQDLFCNLATENNRLLWGVEDYPGDSGPEQVDSDQAVFQLTSKAGHPQWPGFVETSFYANTPGGTGNGAVVTQQVQQQYLHGGVAGVLWQATDPLTHLRGSGNDSTTEDVCAQVLPDSPYYSPAVGLYFQYQLESLTTELNSFVIPGTTTRIPVLLRIFPEMNGDWDWWGHGSTDTEPGHCTPAQFRGLYKYVVDWLADSAPGEPAGQPMVKNALTVWAVAGSTATNGTELDHMVAPFYPGAAYVDVVGVDDYDTGANSTELMSNASEVLSRLQGIIEFGSIHDKMPAMAEGENQNAGSIPNYWSDYFCVLSSGASCGGQLSGVFSFHALRYAMVWFDKGSKNFAPSQTDPGSDGGFATALRENLDGFQISMATSATGKASSDPWLCSRFDC
jgi:hypothetical protein